MEYIDGFKDMCRNEYNDTIDLLVENTMQYLKENDYEPEYWGIEGAVTSALNDACESVFGTLYPMDAIAYILESGLVFQAFRGELDANDNPYEVMRNEAYERVMQLVGKPDEDEDEE